MTGRKEKFRMKQRENSAAGMVVGMAGYFVLGLGYGIYVQSLGLPVP